MIGAVPAEEIDFWPSECVVCRHERGTSTWSQSQQDAITHREHEHPWLAQHLREDKEKTVSGGNQYTKFWMVVRQHGPHSHNPTRRHATFDEAQGEASRLAAKESDVFYVLEAQTYAEPEAAPIRVGKVVA